MRSVRNGTGGRSLPISENSSCGMVRDHAIPATRFWVTARGMRYAIRTCGRKIALPFS
jgi:hypothetical protein